MLVLNIQTEITIICNTWNKVCLYCNSGVTEHVFAHVHHVRMFARFFKNPCSNVRCSLDFFKIHVRVFNVCYFFQTFVFECSMFAICSKVLCSNVRSSLKFSKSYVRMFDVRYCFLKFMFVCSMFAKFF